MGSRLGEEGQDFGSEAESHIPFILLIPSISIINGQHMLVE